MTAASGLVVLQGGTEPRRYVRGVFRGITPKMQLDVFLELNGNKGRTGQFGSNASIFFLTVGAKSTNTK